MTRAGEVQPVSAGFRQSGKSRPLGNRGFNGEWHTNKGHMDGLAHPRTRSDGLTPFMHTRRDTHVYSI